MADTTAGGDSAHECSIIELVSGRSAHALGGTVQDCVTVRTSFLILPRTIGVAVAGGVEAVYYILRPV